MGRRETPQLRERPDELAGHHCAGFFETVGGANHNKPARVGHCGLCAAVQFQHHGPVGYFAASTGAGAALVAAADPRVKVAAVVSRGGRPDRTL